MCCGISGWHKLKDRPGVVLSFFVMHTCTLTLARFLGDCISGPLAAVCVCNTCVGVGVRAGAYLCMCV